MERHHRHDSNLRRGTRSNRPRPLHSLTMAVCFDIAVGTVQQALEATPDAVTSVFNALEAPVDGLRQTLIVHRD